MRNTFIENARSFAEFVEPRHVEAVEMGVTGGWQEREIAVGLLWRAVFHCRVLMGTAQELGDVEADIRGFLHRAEPECSCS